MLVRIELQYYYLKIAGFMAELLQLRFYGFMVFMVLWQKWRFYGFYDFMAEMEVLWFYLFKDCWFYCSSIEQRK